MQPGKSTRRHAPSQNRQTEDSVRKNSAFFADNLQPYSTRVQQLDTYTNIRLRIEEAIWNTRLLLDVGNGGVFDYDTALVCRVVALDLFLHSLPAGYRNPPNVTLCSGSALDLPNANESFDAVLAVMLLHHLVGRTVEETVLNIRRAISESFRVLKRGGKLIVIESCVPHWFFTFETIVFPLASRLINFFATHPATLQFPPGVVAQLLAEETGERAEVSAIPMGTWVLQYGVKVPAALSPVMPYRFVILKH